MPARNSNPERIERHGRYTLDCHRGEGTGTERAGKLVVTLDGAVDLDHAPAVRAMLLDCVGRKQGLVVDLSAVEYIDNSGIANLVEALQAAQQDGIDFGLVAVTGQVTRVLQLARLGTVFRIHANLDDALGAAA